MKDLLQNFHQSSSFSWYSSGSSSNVSSSSVSSDSALPLQSSMRNKKYIKMPYQTAMIEEVSLET